MTGMMRVMRTSHHFPWRRMREAPISYVGDSAWDKVVLSLLFFSAGTCFKKRYSFVGKKRGFQGGKGREKKKSEARKERGERNWLKKKWQQDVGSKEGVQALRGSKEAACDSQHFRAAIKGKREREAEVDRRRAFPLFSWAERKSQRCCAALQNCTLWLWPLYCSLVLNMGPATISLAFILKTLLKEKSKLLFYLLFFSFFLSTEREEQ